LVSILLYAGAATLAAGEFPGVTSAPVGERLFFPRHSAPAEVASLNQASIPAEVEGRLLELSARVGDRVAAGQPLARLDCRDHELRLRQAQAGLEAAAAAQRLAERQLVRVKSLRADQAASADNPPPCPAPTPPNARQHPVTQVIYHSGIGFAELGQAPPSGGPHRFQARA
jgi:multidrug efflux pump subunit AcrA (membrane-fusion protein)